MKINELNNRIKNIHFLQKALIEWASEETKETMNKRNYIKKKLLEVEKQLSEYPI